jgi:orotate phosphoribosyltransferase
MNVKQLLIDAGVVKKGHFILRSGMHSDTYINKDDIVLSTMAYIGVITQLSNLIDLNVQNNFDVISGPAVAGICFAAPVAIKMGIPFTYPEKAFNDYIDGVYEPGGYEFKFRSNFKDYLKGKRVILIEDIITSGISVVKTCQSVTKCGGEVVGIACIWNRKPGLIILNNLTDKKRIPIYSLVTEKVDAWIPKECPLCKEGEPLINPKTGEVIE